MKEETKFEVIVPCYNAESTLERTLNSMVNQTYTNWRVWFINDGSTDSSYEIAKKFADKDRRFVLFSGQNQGVASAMNFARSAILDSYYSSPQINTVAVTCCGSDDWFDPIHFEIYDKEFRKDPTIDLLYSDVSCLFVDGSKAISYGIAYHNVFDPTKIASENPIYAPAATWKLKCFSVGEFDIRLNSIEDWDFYARLVFAGYKIVHLPKVLSYVTVRMTGEGMAGKKTGDQWELFQKKRREEQVLKIK